MKYVPYVKSLIGDTETPITVFQKYVGDKIGFLLESKSTEKSRYSFIGTNPKSIIYQENKVITVLETDNVVTYDCNILDFLKTYMANYEICNHTKIPFIGGAVGTIGYDIAMDYNNLSNTTTNELNVPVAHFLFITEFIAYDHDYGKILLVAVDTDDLTGKSRAEKKLKEMEKSLEKQPKSSYPSHLNTPKSVKKLTSNMNQETFITKVRKAKKYIEKGDISQVVISKRWKATSDIHPLQLYRNLRFLNPSPYLFYFNFGTYQVVGSSPEMLVEVRNEEIYTCPIAGTRKRGTTPPEDLKLEKELLSDPKEIKEHIMLVELSKKDMEQVSHEENIHVQNYMQVQKFSHVMHITSLVTGKKKENISTIDIIKSFLPAGTLSGSPRMRAMEIIDELEEERRGLYGGAIGYLGCDGNMDMCIAIRMLIVKDHKVYMQAGAGIVADSNPENEYEECKNKIAALIATLSMGRENNENYYEEDH